MTDERLANRVRETARRLPDTCDGGAGVKTRLHRRILKWVGAQPAVATEQRLTVRY